MCFNYNKPPMPSVKKIIKENELKMNYKSVLEKQIEILQEEQNGLLKFGEPSAVCEMANQIKLLVEVANQYSEECVNKNGNKMISLREVATRCLVEELALRTGVNAMAVKPYEKYKIQREGKERGVSTNGEGPVIILTVID